MFTWKIGNTSKIIYWILKKCEHPNISAGLSHLGTPDKTFSTETSFLMTNKARLIKARLMNLRWDIVDCKLFFIIFNLKKLLSRLATVTGSFSRIRSVIHVLENHSWRSICFFPYFLMAWRQHLLTDWRSCQETPRATPLTR